MARVARSESVEVIRNVAQERSGVRSIAWLGFCRALICDNDNLGLINPRVTLVDNPAPLTTSNIKVLSIRARIEVLACPNVDFIPLDGLKCKQRVSEVRRRLRQSSDLLDVGGRQSCSIPTADARNASTAGKQQGYYHQACWHGPNEN
jgi:hypothetical protein